MYAGILRADAIHALGKSAVWREDHVIDAQRRRYVAAIGEGAFRDETVVDRHRQAAQFQVINQVFESEGAVFAAAEGDNHLIGLCAAPGVYGSDQFRSERLALFGQYRNILGGTALLAETVVAQM